MDKDKIILMTNMAVYDKRHGDSDRASFSYFRRDYIYRKNMWTRLFVAMGALMLLGIYWLHQLFIVGIDLQALDIQQSVTDSVLFLIAIMAFYTMVGTLQGTHQYYKIQKRMENYLNMTKKLEHFHDDEVEEEKYVYKPRKRQASSSPQRRTASLRRNEEDERYRTEEAEAREARERRRSRDDLLYRAAERRAESASSRARPALAPLPERRTRRVSAEERRYTEERRYREERAQRLERKHREERLRRLDRKPVSERRPVAREGTSRRV